MRADALMKRYIAKSSGIKQSAPQIFIYVNSSFRLKSIGRLACLRLDDGKVYYSDAEDGNKPESETDDIIDKAAKRILDVNAFTELAK